ncbi:hypothetical protein N9B94_00055 [Verrucomicrobia bacterium]|nr:hypothetical protein [Verrucomicrobiota bacterium]
MEHEPANGLKTTPPGEQTVSISFKPLLRKSVAIVISLVET